MMLVSMGLVAQTICNSEQQVFIPNTGCFETHKIEGGIPPPYHLIWSIS